MLLADAYTILVVSHGASRGGELVGALQSRGLPALMATTSREALYWLKECPPAAVLIDLQAVGAGILVPELRRQDREVIALSDDASARQGALAAGCIEAHHRSDSAEEIGMHIASLVRARDVKRVGRILAGPLEVDLAGGKLIFDGEEIALSSLLLNLAAHLAARAGRFVPTSVLLEEVWGEPWADHAKVQLAIFRLRSKLQLDAQSQFLASSRGHGYGVFPEHLERRVMRGRPEHS